METKVPHVLTAGCIAGVALAAVAFLAEAIAPGASYPSRARQA